MEWSQWSLLLYSGNVREEREITLTDSILRYQMSDIFKIPKVDPLSVCPTTPHPQPTPLALRRAAAVVSQVDLLCVTPLKNYMTPCQKKLTGTLHVHTIHALSTNTTRRLHAFYTCVGAAIPLTGTVCHTKRFSDSREKRDTSREKRETSREKRDLSRKKRDKRW